MKIIWSIGSIVVLGTLLNAIIIISAYIYSSGLFWILLITIPLLVIGIYNAQQTNNILGKFSIISPHGSEKQNKYEWLSHSVYNEKISETDLKVQIGNDQCNQPYNACIFNLQSLKSIHPKKSLQATISKKPDYSKNLCEEKLRTYCIGGEDLVLQIVPNFIGCGTGNGNFNNKIFKENACLPEVKMIELILSAAIKPVHNVDSSLDIGDTHNIKTNIKVFPTSSYSTFREAEGMIHFLDSLRELSGKKPIGIRLSIRDKKEFHEICYAIRKTQLIPDFIVVEGSFETTSTVYADKGIHTEMPLYEALLFVSQTLQIYGLETKIKIIASGKIISCFDILRVLALGANVVCTEMPDYTPTEGKTFPFYKVQNLNNFHNSLIKATIQTMKVCGFMNVSDITLSKLFRRLDILHSMGFENLNGPILHSGTIKKIFNSKTKSYRLQEERRKESIA